MNNENPDLPINITLSEASWHIYRNNNLDLNALLDLALHIFDAEKQACLHAAFNDNMDSDLLAVGGIDVTASLEDKIHAFFSAKNGDLTSLFSFAFNIGYARADRILASLIDKGLLTKASGYKLQFLQ